MFPPRRIVCLTEETVETLYLLGEEDRIAGISGYTVRPPRARREKPRVSAFISADIPKILALEPDLVLAFSDIQAQIVHDLVKAGVNVHAFNQRTLAEILDMIVMLGALTGKEPEARLLVDRLNEGMTEVAHASAALPLRPRVYFEEWDEPAISGIAWVSELIALAGGDDIFGDLADRRSAKDRIVTYEEVAAREPDLIIGSWCGKKFRPEKVAARPEFAGLSALRDGALHEIKSPIILQPGPASLTEGLEALRGIIHARAHELAVSRSEKILT
ncbi:cobalamin-binding protein [Parvibaculum sp.]|jgi:iron complex transport system substrate-binding protein|uniref:cobalamin-binding protein n=1 Tax=Parvibaculum sp. TaxID=2024848 RepID=UPI001B2AC85F|nr:cobalamin-binding protein [Parvibaculum sp.]MBO6668068.1 cobalamin-binding protein [Parvibaculum sp.]MBO6692034.1 cobalamin-binding protein [Parvibaculum sp.]MBO6715616.1 cobalamin-binding protein [Parvibaculum sp.]